MRKDNQLLYSTLLFQYCELEIKKIPALSAFFFVGKANKSLPSVKIKGTIKIKINKGNIKNSFFKYKQYLNGKLVNSSLI